MLYFMTWWYHISGSPSDPLLHNMVNSISKKKTSFSKKNPDRLNMDKCSLNYDHATDTNTKHGQLSGHIKNVANINPNSCNKSCQTDNSTTWTPKNRSISAIIRQEWVCHPHLANGTWINKGDQRQHQHILSLWQVVHNGTRYIRHKYIVTLNDIWTIPTNLMIGTITGFNFG
jgi:hypothetical protein